MTNEETKTITLSSGENVLKIEATGSESGDGENEIPAEVNGEISSGFNYIYILDMLKALNSEKVTLKFRDESTPMKIENADFTHIIMPVKNRG